MEEDSYAYLSKGRQGKTPKGPKMLKHDFLEELYLFIFYIVLSTNYSAVFAYKERQKSIYKQLNILTPIRELAFLFRSPDNSYWTICSSAKTIKKCTRKSPVSHFWQISTGFFRRIMLNGNGIVTFHYVDIPCSYENTVLWGRQYGVSS